MRYHQRSLTKAQIFDLCGSPNEATWPDYRRLPNARHIRQPTQQAQAKNSLAARFDMLSEAGMLLLASLLSLNPANRPSAAQIVTDAYFTEKPRPKPTAMFPTFPSKAGQEKRRRLATPHAPVRGEVSNIGFMSESTILVDGRRDDSSK